MHDLPGPILYSGDRTYSKVPLPLDLFRRRTLGVDLRVRAVWALTLRVDLSRRFLHLTECIYYADEDLSGQNERKQLAGFNSAIQRLPRRLPPELLRLRLRVQCAPLSYIKLPLIPMYPFHLPSVAFTS